MWKKEESFSEYLHQKIILGNRVSVNDKIVEYIIEGIPDPVLRNLARAQKIKTKKDLLELFDITSRISLQGQFVPNPTCRPADSGFQSKKDRGRKYQRER